MLHYVLDYIIFFKSKTLIVILINRFYITINYVLPLITVISKQIYCYALFNIHNILYLIMCIYETFEIKCMFVLE